MYADTITLLKSYIKRVKALHETLDVENRQEKVRALEEKMAAPGFWDDNDAAQEKSPCHEKHQGRPQSQHRGGEASHGPPHP